jgi:hypothetical protein
MASLTGEDWPDYILIALDSRHSFEHPHSQDVAYFASAFQNSEGFRPVLASRSCLGCKRQQPD